MQVWHLRLIPETHPNPPCREGAKDKGCLGKDKTIRIALTFFY